MRLELTHDRIGWSTHTLHTVPCAKKTSSVETFKLGHFYLGKKENREGMFRAPVEWHLYVTTQATGRETCVRSALEKLLLRE